MNSYPKFFFTLPIIAAFSGNENACAKGIEEKPINIVYIMSDDHSFQTISAYDKSNTLTPNIDRLAQDGVRFTNSFVCNSISGPSRAAMLTGKHSYTNGKIDNERAGFDMNQPNFAKYLQKASYQTALIGKWHLGDKPQGFDHWEILDGQGTYYNPDFITDNDTTRIHGYVTDLITDKSIEWMENRDKSNPFCLLIHHKAVHRSWIGNSTDMNEFEDREFKLPETFYDDYNGRKAAAAQKMSIDKDMDLAYDLKVDVKTPMDYGRAEIGRMDKGQRAAYDALYDRVTKEYKESNMTGSDLAEWKYQRYMRDYLKCVKSMDDNIGRVIDYLEKEGLLENTIIVYTSDQGFYMGEHGWFDKRFMYEESFRTPLVAMLPPSLKKRGDINQLVQNIDYAPTFLELAGVPVPEDMHGESLMPLLKGEKPNDWRHSLYYHYFEHPGEHAVRMHYGVRNERYKLIRFYGHDIETWEMYDLKKDPNEMNNIYDNPKYSSVQKDLHNELDNLRVKYKEN